MTSHTRRHWLALALAPAVPEPRAVLRVPFQAPGENPLSAADVKVSMGGKPARIVRLLAPGSDLFLLLVLDLSGDLTLVDPARQALLSRLTALPDNARIALMRAQDGLRPALDPGAPRAELLAAVESLSPAPRPGLLDAIESAQMIADSVAARAHVRVAAVFISDSSVLNYQEDYSNPVVNSSDSGDMSRRFPEGLIKEKIRQITARMRHGESPLYLVHLQYLSDRLNTAYQTGLQELMRSTGGAAEFCRSLADIPASVDRAFDAILRAQYMAEVEMPGARGNTIELLVTAEGRTIHSRPRRQFSQKGR